MRYDIDYRGFRIRGSGHTTYGIYRYDRLVGGQNYMKDAKAWVDLAIEEGFEFTDSEGRPLRDPAATPIIVTDNT